ncbi:MAG: type II secretion system F family protein [Micrococcales bacterium]
MLQRAGFQNYKQVSFLAAGGGVLIVALVYELPGLIVLAVAASVGSLALAADFVGKRANLRSKRIVEEWPVVLESLESAVSSGLSLLEAFRDIAEAHSMHVSADFEVLCAELERGINVDEALQHLAGRLAMPTCDLTIQTLRQVNRAGGLGLTQSLHAQANLVREQELLVEQLQAKQGWVLGTAKIAVASPWVVIALVSLRAENARLYASVPGVAITAFGLVASILAYRLVSKIGRIDVAERVFA